MPGPITKQQTRTIIKKLKAVKLQPGSAHDVYAIFHEGSLIASFGVRRSSKKDMAQPHIPNDLGVNEHYVRGLISCSNSLEDWLRNTGHLEEG